MPEMVYQIPVVMIKEGNAFIAYSPAIEVSASGETYQKAQERFEEASQLFFEELLKAGTTKEALLELGWEQGGKRLIPPSILNHTSVPISVGSHNYAQALSC